jgi:hypothetical protein
MTERRLTFEEIARLASEDPDDRAIREAHGFSYVDDFEDRSLLCRNGCGASYFDIAVGKIRECSAASSGDKFPFGREGSPIGDPINPFSARALFARGHWAEAASTSEPQTDAPAAGR